MSTHIFSSIAEGKQVASQVLTLEKGDSSSDKFRDKFVSLLSVCFLEDCAVGRRSGLTYLKNPTVAGGRLAEPQIC